MLTRSWTLLRIAVIAGLIVGMTWSDAMAQRGGRGRGSDRDGGRDSGGDDGDRDRGRDRGQEGDRGGDRGGGPSFGGGRFGGGQFGGGQFGGRGEGQFGGGQFGGRGEGQFGGGQFGGRGGGRGGSEGGGFDPSGFIRRMDENGNGVLDPSESQGRMRFMIERVMPGVDLNRPIPLDRVVRSFEDMRRDRENDRERDRDRDDRDRDDDSSAAVEPLVPGFGVEVEHLPVPGFGSAGELYGTVSSEDRDQAQRTISRYDRDRNGLLDSDEIRRGRWSDNPLRYDFNGDGMVSSLELSSRFAQRRADEESRRSGSGSSRSRDNDDDERRRDDRRSTDQRGEEQQRGGRGGRGGGRGGFGGGNWGGWGEGADEEYEEDGGGSSSKPASASTGPTTYRFSTSYDRLPKGLPDWFVKKDADFDGQVMMSEYASNWTDALVEEFARLDTNGDGVLTPQESAAGRAIISSRPSTRTVASRSEESGDQDSSDRESDEATASADSADSEVAQSSSNDTQEDTTASDGQPESAYVTYAAGIIKKYDTNGDRTLTKTEWSAMSKDPSEADRDGNGRITAEEYAFWLQNSQF